MEEEFCDCGEQITKTNIADNCFSCGCTICSTCWDSDKDGNPWCGICEPDVDEEE